MSNDGLLWLMWSGCLLLLILLLIASYSSPKRWKRILYALLAAVNILPFPIFFPQGTVLFPAWMLGWCVLAAYLALSIR
jgi:hypothetical protein